jgi:hypothetical protein
MAIVLLLVMYALGSNVIVIHVVGATLTLGRLLHAFGLSRNVGTSAPRFLGMILTWLAYIVAILVILWLTFAPAAS